MHQGPSVPWSGDGREHEAGLSRERLHDVRACPASLPAPPSCPRSCRRSLSSPHRTGRFTLRRGCLGCRPVPQIDLVMRMSRVRLLSPALMRDRRPGCLCRWLSLSKARPPIRPVPPFVPRSHSRLRRAMVFELLSSGLSVDGLPAPLASPMAGMSPGVL